MSRHHGERVQTVLTVPTGAAKFSSLLEESPGNKMTTVSAHILLGLLLTSGCSIPQAPSPPSITIDNDRATVRGVVRENVVRCEVDGPCYLVLNGEPAGVRVYYHHGEAPACANQRSTDTGLSIRAGDSIEASGIYSLVNRTHTVDVCCADCRLAVTRRQ